MIDSSIQSRLKGRAGARRREARIGHADHGRRMSLDRFNTAIATEGLLCELQNGVVQIQPFPELSHSLRLQAVYSQLVTFKSVVRNRIRLSAGRGEAKVLIASAESERHPDLSIYLTDPPDVDDVWSYWTPEILIEMVDRESTDRDYRIKPGEYLTLGVAEYWIIDGQTRRMTANTRWRGQWKQRVLKPSQKYTTPLLPGFGLDLKRVFTAGR